MFVNRYGVLMAGAKLERKRGPLTVLRGEQVQQEEPETAVQLLARLGTDGMKWAAEFEKVAIEKGAEDIDPELLLGWFANAIAIAIEAGRSAGYSDARTEFQSNLAGFIPAVEPPVHVELSPVLQMTLRGLADDYGPLGVVMCCEKMWPGLVRAASLRLQRPEGKQIDPKEAS